MSIKIILLFIFSTLLSFSKFVSCSVYKLSDLSHISKKYLVGEITFDNVIESIFDFIQYNSSFDLFVNFGISNSSCAEALIKAKNEQESLYNVTFDVNYNFWFTFLYVPLKHKTYLR